MDALRKVYHNAQGQDFRRTVREVKNKIYNYNEMEQLVREATCNDARTPNEMLMKEIAKGTFTVDFSAIMAIVWKRLKDKNSEHHPYKCLVLLGYLLREGNAEMVQSQVNNNMHLIQALTSFRLMNENHIDVGYQVREQATKFLRELQGEGADVGGGGGGAQSGFGSSGFSQGGGDGGGGGGGFGGSDFSQGGGGNGGFGGSDFSQGGGASGGGFGSDEFSKQGGGEDWKSNVEWDEDDGPSTAGGGGGKFKVSIKDPGSPAMMITSPGASVANVRLSIGQGNAPSGRARPTRGPAGSFGASPTASLGPKPAAATAEPNLFEVDSQPTADPFAAAPDPFAAAPDPFAAPPPSAPADPFASTSDPFGASAATPFAPTPSMPPPAPAAPASLLEGSMALGSTDELLALAAPTDPMSNGVCLGGGGLCSP